MNQQPSYVVTFCLFFVAAAGFSGCHDVSVDFAITGETALYRNASNTSEEGPVVRYRLAERYARIDATVSGKNETDVPFSEKYVIEDRVFRDAELVLGILVMQDLSDHVVRAQISNQYMGYVGIQQPQVFNFDRTSGSQGSQGSYDWFDLLAGRPVRLYARDYNLPAGGVRPLAHTANLAMENLAKDAIRRISARIKPHQVENCAWGRPIAVGNLRIEGDIRVLKFEFPEYRIRLQCSIRR